MPIAKSLVVVVHPISWIFSPINSIMTGFPRIPKNHRQKSRSWDFLQPEKMEQTEHVEPWKGVIRGPKVVLHSDLKKMGDLWKIRGKTDLKIKSKVFFKAPKFGLTCNTCNGWKSEWKPNLPREELLGLQRKHESALHYLQHDNGKTTPKTPIWHSMKSWLINRDPYFMACYNPYITG